MNEQEMLFVAESQDVQKRIDSFLSEKAEGYTRSRIQKLLDEKLVFVNGKIVSKSYKLCDGDEVMMIISENQELDIVAEDIPLDIVFEDEHLLVVNKPKGMVVHPAAGNYSGTLVNALMFHCKDSLSGINGVNRPGIVHRIDKDTSGLIVVAKNDAAHIGLAEQFAEHSITREYHAVVYGNIKNDDGTVDAPIGRHPVNRKQMAIVYTNSKRAVTHYKVLERFGDFTYISCKLETGRTHQIRVHMTSLNHPLAGDGVYGPKKVIKKLEGQCLHAKILGFKHPITGEELLFESQLPTYFSQYLDSLRK